MCQDRDEDGQFVKVSAHCPIPIARKLTVLAHGLILDQPGRSAGTRSGDAGTLDCSGVDRAPGANAAG